MNSGEPASQRHFCRRPRLCRSLLLGPAPCSFPARSAPAGQGLLHPASVTVVGPWLHVRLPLCAGQKDWHQSALWLVATRCGTPLMGHGGRLRSVACVPWGRSCSFSGRKEEQSFKLSPSPPLRDPMKQVKTAFLRGSSFVLQTLPNRVCSGAARCKVMEVKTSGRGTSQVCFPHTDSALCAGPTDRHRYTDAGR